MNCSSHIYHQNEFGHTRKCTCCDAVHLVFGNISLLLSKGQVRDFTLYISETLTIECSVYDENDRCVYLPTRDCSLMFALSYHELKLLAEILEQTLLMFQIDDVLSTNNHNS